jgi:hypothetical protein
MRIQNIALRDTTIRSSHANTPEDVALGIGRKRRRSQKRRPQNASSQHKGFPAPLAHKRGTADVCLRHVADISSGDVSCQLSFIDQRLWGLSQHR